jgi:hypothetical protein
MSTIRLLDSDCPTQQQDSLEILKDLAQNMRGILFGVIDVQNCKVLATQKIDLRTILQSVFRDVRSLVKNKNIKFQLKWSNTISKTYGLGNYIFEVLFDILSNAIESTEKGTITLSAANSTVGFVRIAIEDKGMVNKIALPPSRWLIEMMGGTFENAVLVEGRSARCVIELPVWGVGYQLEKPREFSIEDIIAQGIGPPLKAQLLLLEELSENCPERYQPKLEATIASVERELYVLNQFLLPKVI